MRKQLFQIVNDGNKKSNIYNLVMLIAIIVSLIPLCTKSQATWTIIVEEVTVTIFIIDYILRLITADYKYPSKGAFAFLRYPFGTMAIIDLLSILPSFGVFSQGLKILKVFRLFRTFKVFKALKAFKAFKALKILRYSKSIALIGKVIKSQKEALVTVGGLRLDIFSLQP